MVACPANPPYASAPSSPPSAGLVPARPYGLFSRNADKRGAVLGGQRDALPKVLNQKSAKALLQEYGWSEERGGKHSVKMVKEGNRPITLPRHQGKDYGKGLTSSILKQAGLRGPDKGADA